MEIISNLIYFNNNGTTVTDPEVSAAMVHFTNHVGANAIETGKALDAATAKIASLLNCDPGQIIFTKNTSDGISLGIKGAYQVLSAKGNHIITNVTEHPAILRACKELEERGAMVTYLGVDREGLVDPEELQNHIGPGTVLVSIMAANNETGVIQPIEKIAAICKEHNLVFFSDGSQYVGKMRCDVNEAGFDLLAFCAHKLYGPRDTGILYVKEPKRFPNIKNTIDVGNPSIAASVVGMGKMAELLERDHWENSTHISKLKNYFEHHLLDIEGLRINGSTRYRLYNTSNIQFPNTKVADLADRFVFAHNKTSHVLKAMGLSAEETAGSFRFSFGKYNTMDEVKLLTNELLHLMTPETITKS